MAFLWSLSDSMSPQVSRTLLSIVADLNNAVVWMVSTRPFIFKSSSPFTNTLMTVPRARVAIGIIVNLMFYSFFDFIARSKYLSFFSFSFNSILWFGLQSPQFYKFSLLFTPLEFFTSVLADGFSLAFEWQQVSSSLQDSSQDSGRS